MIFRLGSRVWTREEDKPRTPLANALSFKIASFVAKADALKIRVDAHNPTGKCVDIEVSFIFVVNLTSTNHLPKSFD